MYQKGNHSTGHYCKATSILLIDIEFGIQGFTSLVGSGAALIAGSLEIT
jgi:hypothetical protein